MYYEGTIQYCGLYLVMTSEHTNIRSRVDQRSAQSAVFATIIIVLYVLVYLPNHCTVCIDKAPYTIVQYGNHTQGRSRGTYSTRPLASYCSASRPTLSTIISYKQAQSIDRANVAIIYCSPLYNVQSHVQPSSPTVQFNLAG